MPAGDCAHYEELIGSDFSFKVQFTDSDSYMRIPLFSLSESATDADGNATCNIFVQYLDDTIAGNVGTSDVILGAMVFQQFYGEFTNLY